MSQPVGLFVDHRKGEIAELKKQLRSPEVDRDFRAKREVIKRVVAYMTIGIDVSPLFSEMIMKKLVYLYISNLADQNAELSVLVVNTLLKDCSDSDPMVRGLALRALCSLRSENLIEYLPSPIKNGLGDPSPYVRRIAVMAAVKLFHLSPEVFRNNGFLQALEERIRDRDAQVMVNAVIALDEALAFKGGMEVTRSTMQLLVNRIRDVSEFAQCSVLAMVHRYDPENEDEVVDMLNALDDLLKSGNSAVVLATCKVFLKITQHLPSFYNDVVARIRQPLVTMSATSNPERSYAVLKHVRLLAQTHAPVFAPDYKMFFCKFSDPIYVKISKIDILTLIADDQNLEDIVGELTEYVTDVNADLSRRSIRAMGVIATRFADAAGFIAESLIEFLDLEIDYVAAEAVVVLTMLLRKFPGEFDTVVPAALGKSIDVVSDPQAKVAVLWAIGRYAREIDESPYLLEPLIDEYEEEQSHEVKRALLTATMQVFFARPPETQAMLGRLLEAAVNDMSHMQIHDVALLYYRLLQRSVEDAEAVVAKTDCSVTEFAEERDDEITDQLMEEFDTFSVIFEKAAEKFVTKKVAPELPDGFGVSDDHGRDRAYSAASDVGAESGVHEGDRELNPPHAVSSNTYGTKAPSSLLDFGEAASAPAITFDPAASVAAGDFQAKWSMLPDAAQFSTTVTNPSTPVSAVEGALASINIKILASGGNPGDFKLFAFGRDSSSGALSLAQVVLKSGTGAVTLKCEDISQANDVKQVVSAALSSL